jgi:hypothetical protein
MATMIKDVLATITRIIEARGGRPGPAGNRCAPA